MKVYIKIIIYCLSCVMGLASGVAIASVKEHVSAQQQTMTGEIQMDKKQYEKICKMLEKEGWVTADKSAAFDIGVNIPQEMTIPDGAPADKYSTTVVLKKDGVTKEIPMEDWDWRDTTWVYVSTYSVLIEKGYTPPVHDFSIATSEYDDITDEVLSYDGFTFLLVAYNLSRSDSEGLKKATSIASFCQENSHKFYCLTASFHSEIEQIKQNLGLNYEFCTSDGTTLQTMISANPGLVVLHKGIVTGKWHFNKT